MAGKEKRQAELRHLTRALVRENFGVPAVLASLAESMDEQAKNIEHDPKAREEADALERDALALRRLAHDHRAEFG